MVRVKSINRPRRRRTNLILLTLYAFAILLTLTSLCSITSVVADGHKHDDNEKHLEHKLDSRNEEIKKLEKSLDRREEKIDEIKDKLDERDKKIDKLKDDIKHDDKKYAEQKHELHKYEKRETEDRKFEKKLDRREEKLDQRQHELKKDEKELDDDSKDLSHARTKLHRLKKELDTREHDVARREEELDALDRAREDFYYNKYAKPYEKYWRPPDQPADKKHTKHHEHHHTKHHKHHHTERDGDGSGQQPQQPQQPQQIPRTGYEKYYEHYLPPDVRPANGTDSKRRASASASVDAEPLSESDASTPSSPYETSYTNPSSGYSSKPEMDASSELANEAQKPYEGYYSQYVNGGGAGYGSPPSAMKMNLIETTSSSNDTQIQQPQPGQQSQSTQSATNEPAADQDESEPTRYGRFEGKPIQSYPNYSMEENAPRWADSSLSNEERTAEFNRAQKAEHKRQRQLAEQEGHTHLHRHTNDTEQSRDLKRHGRHSFHYQRPHHEHHRQQHDHGQSVLPTDQPQQSSSTSSNNHSMDDEREVYSHEVHREQSSGVMPPVYVFPPSSPNDQNDRNHQNETASGQQQVDSPSHADSMTLSESHHKSHHDHDSKHEREDDHLRHEIRHELKKELKKSEERQHEQGEQPEQPQQPQQQQQPQQPQQSQQPQQGHPPSHYLDATPYSVLVGEKMDASIAVDNDARPLDLTASVSIWMTLFLVCFIMLALAIVFYGPSKYHEWRLGRPFGSYHDAQPLISTKETSQYQAV